MSKTKSAICLVLVSLVIAALCFICFVSFQYGTDGMYTFNSIVVMTQKDADLGATYGMGNESAIGYLGGGYSVIYYPEGVISVREYEETLSGMPTDTTEQQEAKEEYANKYTRIGSLCFETETYIEDGKLTEDFKTQFANAVELLKERYGRLNAEGARIEVMENYSVRVFLPQGQSSTTAYVSAASGTFAQMGEFRITYSADGSEDTATAVIPRRVTQSASDFVKGARSTKAADGTNYVVIDFTDEGKDRLAAATSNAAEEGGTMYFYVGESSPVISLTINTALSDSSLYISNPSSPFSAEQASTMAILIDTALNGTKTTLTFGVDDMVRYEALFGNDALMFLYIAFAVCFVGMMAYFLIRYRLLAFAHILTYLLFLCGTVLCVYAIPFITLSLETFAAFAIASVIFSVSQAIVYENARKEYALGKTIVSSVKGAYKKCLWPLVDLHLAVALIAFITYFIALGELASFAFVLGLTTVFSAVGVLLVGRFMWAITMAYTNNKGKFCNFKREEVEDE